MVNLLRWGSTIKEVKDVWASASHRCSLESQMCTDYIYGFILQVRALHTTCVMGWFQAGTIGQYTMMIETVMMPDADHN